MAAEKPYDFKPPGGQFQGLVGLGITTAGISSVIAPDKMVVHVYTTHTIATLTPPHAGFVGPLYLVADSVFVVGGTGNIATTQGTPKVAGHAYGFIYDPIVGKWYEIGNPI